MKKETPLRTLIFIVCVSVIGIFSSCDRSWESMGIPKNILPHELKQAAGCAGCSCRGNGVLDTSGPQEVQGGVPLEIVMNDDSTLSLSALPCEGTITTVVLEQVADIPDLTGYDIAPEGVTHVLTFDSFDPTDSALYAADFAPTLTLPASTIAEINGDTITVARIADLYLTDEQAQPNRVHFLPATVTENGDLQVTDFYMADSIISDLLLRDAPPEKQTSLHPRRIQYVVGTFAGSYNWNTQPVLQRFYPSENHAAARCTLDGLDAEAQDAENKKVIRNVVVLVHGHNEEEKLGDEDSSAEAPWYLGYKRDVWTPFYRYVREEHPDLLACTTVYEYIYPTYWPIFTPGNGQRLDEDFARRINALVAAGNSGIEDDEEFHVYIVAHSMGGLVTRAGAQMFNSTSHTAFQKLVTWGTPHMGTPLVSLRRVLASPTGIYSVRRGMVSLPLNNIDNTLYAFRRAIENLQRDAPGTRDLRWANSHTTTAHNLCFDDYFSFDVNAALEPALWNLYDLKTGTDIFNVNLNLLNKEDTYRLEPKCRALYGITPKRLEVSYNWLGWPRIEGGYIGAGASVLSWLMEDAAAAYEGALRGDSDSAVPLASMMGAGITVAWERSRFDDMDHEEYFGAPHPHGVFQTEEKAADIARETMRVLDIQTCDVQLTITPASLETHGGVERTFILEAKGIAADITAVTFQWDFGDGDTGSADGAVTAGEATIDITHEYPIRATDETYTLTATVSQEQTELARATAEITVKETDEDIPSTIPINGTFAPYNEGLSYSDFVLDYDVTGIQATEVIDTMGTRIYNGVGWDGVSTELRISGTASGADLGGSSQYAGNIIIETNVGGALEEFKVDIPVNTSPPYSFDVSVPIPEGTTNIHFYISTGMRWPNGFFTIGVRG